MQSICYGPAVRYQFGEFVVDTTSYSISQAGRAVQIRPKVFDLLRYLIEHRDRVVSKRELLEALWREQYVDEFAVPWTVSHARRALGQRKGAQAPIQTVHGRGYRFVAELVEPRAGQPQADAGAPGGEADPFVARERVMQRLTAQLARAQAGRGSCCLLVGEAGIGKTRCLDELARQAAGFAVWRGRSVEATCGPVFWPWIQVLRSLAAERPSLTEEAEAILARLISERDDPAAGPADGPRTPLRSSRFWQYDRIAILLERAAQQGPVLLTFDDLHWADSGTWELLGFLTPELRRWPIAIVGAKREDGRVSSRDPRAHQLRDTDRIELPAFSAGDVAQYVRRLTGQETANLALCQAVQSVSLGNPWFVRETLHALIGRHGLERLAALDESSVQPAGTALDSLRARVAALPADAHGVLSMASVLGERFELDLLARMSGTPIEQVLASLELAREQGMVALEPPRRARFRHGLWRSVCYEELAIARRMELHHEAARALEQTLDPLHYGEIAYHSYCSLPLQDPAGAAQAAVRAADLAARAQAFGDAAQFLEWATSAQQNDPSVPPRARAELLLRRAQTERMASRETLARATAVSAIDLARQHGYHDLVVNAVRVLRFSFGVGNMPDPLALSVLEKLLEECPQHAQEERVNALSLLAWIPPYALDMERSKSLSGEALALARQLARPAGLREALQARLYALSGPDDIEALLATVAELTAVAHDDAAWFAIEARMASYRAELYRGKLAAADTALAALGREAQAQGLAEALWYHDLFRAQRLFAGGDFARSEALLTDLAERGARLHLPHAPILDAVARTLLTYEREGAPALAEQSALDGMLAVLVSLPASYAATGARLAVELGRREPARQVLHQLSQRDFAPVVKDLGYVNALANLGVVAIMLEDRERARAIYERLAPYPHHNTPNGVVGFFEGSASRFLAGLAVFLGDHNRAKRHFEEALAMNEQLELLPQVARTTYEWARWLFAQQRPGARSLKQRALELAEQLGMRHLAECARTLS